MSRLLVLLGLFSAVFGSLTVSTVQVEESYDTLYDVKSSSDEAVKENEVNDYDYNVFSNENNHGRSKRHEVSSSDLIRSESQNARSNSSTNSHQQISGGHVIWRDNTETRRLGHGNNATIIRVIHHGIYPSLNITEPIGTYSTRQSFHSHGRLKRNSVQNLNNSQLKVVSTEKVKKHDSYSGVSVQNQVRRARAIDNTNINHNFSEFRRSHGYSLHNDHDRRRNMSSGTVKNTYNAHYPPANFTGVKPRGKLGSAGYFRAVHPASGSENYKFYANQRHINSNRTRNLKGHYNNSINSTKSPNSKYRTLYFPEPNSINNSAPGYKGDPQNKGHVRLISAGYYSINGSRDDVRSYHNPQGDWRHRRSHEPKNNGSRSADQNFGRVRSRRDTSSVIKWLDSFVDTFWHRAVDNNEIQDSSDVVKLETINEVDDFVQNHYGYSSNGHSHSSSNKAVRIFLARSDSNSASSKASQQSGLFDAAIEPITPQPEAVPTSTSAHPFRDSTTSKTILTSAPTMGIFESAKTPTTRSTSETTENAETTTLDDTITLPIDGPVLIRAPPRKLNCKPPKRQALGRCRTVW